MCVGEWVGIGGGGGVVLFLYNAWLTDSDNH